MKAMLAAPDRDHGDERRKRIASQLAATARNVNKCSIKRLSCLIGSKWTSAYKKNINPGELHINNAGRNSGACDRCNSDEFFA